MFVDNKASSFVFPHTSGERSKVVTQSVSYIIHSVLLYFMCDETNEINAQNSPDRYEASS